MKLKTTEIKVDKEFEKFGAKPRIFHFRDNTPFGTITIATKNTNWNWNDILTIIRECGRNSYDYYLYFHATHLMHELATQKIYGVAICDKRSQFYRQKGRVIAKGRLLKHMKRERQNDNKM